MKKILSFLLVFVMMFGLLSTTAFGEEDFDHSALDMSYYGKYKDKGYSISVYSWGEYISDGSDGSIDTNAAFEEVTGIKVIYSNYDTNESLYAKLKTGGTTYDVIVPSDYMVSRMIAEGMLQKVNLNNIPNISNIEGKYLYQTYDPQNEYSVPFTWGVLGLIYNTSMVEDESVAESWNALWNEGYIGSILMINNSKDAMGITFKYLGYPINAESYEQVDDAVEMLKKQKSFIQAYVADEIFDKMIGGEAAFAPYFNGDAVTMIDDNDDLAFSIPKEGSNIFTDCWCIPVDSKKAELAEMYINFMLEPEIGLANAEAIGYSTPNMKVYELLDEETQNNPVAYPAQEDLERCEYYNYVGPDLSLYIDGKWAEVLTSDEYYSGMIMPIFVGGCLALVFALNMKRSKDKKKRANMQ